MTETYLVVTAKQLRTLISGLGWMDCEGAATPRTMAFQRALIRKYCRTFGHKARKKCAGTAYDGKPFAFQLCDVCHKDLLK